MKKTPKGIFTLLPKFLGNPRIKNIAVALLVVGLAGTTIYFQQQYSGLRENPNRIVEAETAALLADVGRLMVLPSDEAPVVATVNDPEQLADQNFFGNAKVGDKVIIYAQNGKAILYDPVAKKIIDIATININNEEASPPPPEPATAETGQAEEEPEVDDEG